MECETVLKSLDVFRTGDVNEREYRRLERHLADCPECADALARIRHLSSQLAQLHVRAPEGVLDWVLARSGDWYGSVHTGLGLGWVGWNNLGITIVRLDEGDGENFASEYRSRLGRQPKPGRMPQAYAHLVRKAATGETPPLVSIDLSSLSSFERQVLMLLKTIPRGEVRPYNWLAREVGRPGAVRAVGNVLARNPVPLLLPCHRVVRAQGSLGGYIFGSALKRRLLAQEGAPIDELQDLTRRGVRFIGSRNTRIYCFPSCRHARRIAERNRVALAGEKEARRAGYRPCRDCRPAAERRA